MSENFHPQDYPIDRNESAPAAAVDPGALAGDTNLGTDPRAEFLRDGAIRLTASVTEVIETRGAEAVPGYLNDVLADTEGRFPPAERAAAIHALANEQRNTINRSLVGQGEATVETLAANNANLRSSLTQGLLRARRGPQETVEMFRQKVGTHLGNNVDVRRAKLGQAETNDQARKGFGAASGRIKELTDWQAAQSSAVKAYGLAVEGGVTHKRALNEAEKTTDPSYDGEPRNFTNLVDESVKAAAAALLVSAITEAQSTGISPEEAVQRILEQEPDTLTAAQVKRLTEFTTNFDTQIKKRTAVVKAKAADSARGVDLFMRNGNTAYDRLRNNQDAAEALRKQRSALEPAANLAIEALDAARAAFAQADDTTEQMCSRS